MDCNCPYEFTGLAMGDNCPYEFVGYGVMDCQLASDFIGFGVMDGNFQNERARGHGWPVPS